MNGAPQIFADRGHAATRVLAALWVHGKRAQTGIAPDFDWLEGLLSYIERTVRGVHFGSEEAILARPLEQLRPDLRAKIARLRRDHIGTGGYCFRMKEALGHWRKGWPEAINMYLGNARDHLRLSAAHGLLIRRTILPAAEAVFSPAHWQAATPALAGASDPLAGCMTRTQFDAALSRMMGRQEAPMSTLRPVKPGSLPEHRAETH